MLKNLTKILLICFVSAVISSNATAAPLACDSEDLPCIRRLLLNSEEVNDQLKLQLDGKDKLIKLSEEQLQILTTQNQALGKAASQALAVAQGQLRPWYESPVLWTGIGLVVGVVLTVAVGAVVARSWQPVTP